jgi:hypothetical protein
MTEPQIDREMVKIPCEEYNRMLNEIAFLNALRAAGVDNWQGIDAAYELLREWKAE